MANMSNMSNTSNMSTNNDKVFILLTTENGNGYVDELNQKIVVIAYDNEAKTDIKNILYLINKQNTKNKKTLNLNIVEYDLTIMNFDFLGKYEEMTNYKTTKIFSIDVDNEIELSTIMLNLYSKMNEYNEIKQILYTRRKKYNGYKKVFFFLIKVFIDINYSNNDIKSNILSSNLILNKQIKIKINDIEINKNNKNEQGIKKNNWENFN